MVLGGLVGIDPGSIDAAVEHAMVHGVPEGFHEEIPPERKGLSPALLATVLGAHLLNAATTDLALDTARSRGLEAREANPVLSALSRPDGLLYGSRMATGAATALGSNMLAKHGHRGAGKAVAVAGTVLPLIAAAFDLTAGRRDPRQNRGGP